MPVRKAAPDAVGRAAADREHRVPQRLIQAHQRAVVLGEVRHRLQPVRGERLPHRPGDVAGHPGQGPVEDSGVLPLEQPDRADLVAERNVDLAELTLDHVGGLELMPRRDRSEHAGDRDALGLVADLAEEPGDGVGVQRGQVLPVELDAAFDDRGPDRDGLGELGWPPEHRPDAERGRGAEPEHGHPPQVAAFKHGVRGMRGAEHDVADPAGLRPGGGQDGVDGRGDPASDVRGGRHLGGGDHPVVGVHDHRVGVGAADVDAETAVRRGHRQAPLLAGSRNRSQRLAGPRSRCPARSARADRSRTRSP